MLRWSALRRVMGFKSVALGHKKEKEKDKTVNPSGGTTTTGASPKPTATARGGHKRSAYAHSSTAKETEFVKPFSKPAASDRPGRKFMELEQEEENVMTDEPKSRSEKAQQEGSRTPLSSTKRPLSTARSSGGVGSASTGFSSPFRDVSTDALSDELLRYGRRKQTKEVVKHVGQVLDEMIRRVEELSPRAFREGCYTAQSKGLYRRGVELAIQKLRCSANDFLAFSLYEAVVDCSYEEKAVKALIELCEGGVRKLQVDPTDVRTELAVYRCFWRIVQLGELPSVGRVKGTQQQATSLQRERRRQVCRAAARSVFDALVKLTTPKTAESSSSTSASLHQFGSLSLSADSSHPSALVQKVLAMQEEEEALFRTGSSFVSPLWTSTVEQDDTRHAVGDCTTDDASGSEKDPSDRAFEVLYMVTTRHILHGSYCDSSLSADTASPGPHGATGRPEADHGEAYYLRMCYEHFLSQYIHLRSESNITRHEEETRSRQQENKAPDTATTASDAGEEESTLPSRLRLAKSRADEKKTTGEGNSSATNAQKKTSQSSGGQQELIKVIPSVTAAIALIKSCKLAHRTGLAEWFYTQYMVGRAQTDEIVLHAFLEVLVAANDHKRVVRILRNAMYGGDSLRGGNKNSSTAGLEVKRGAPLRDSGGGNDTPGKTSDNMLRYRPSVAVLTLCMKAITETQDVSLALHCFEIVMSNTAGQAPSPYEVFSCLYTLAKCGVGGFEEMVASCVDNQLIAGAAEETAYLLLQHALNIPNAEATAIQVVQNLEDLGEEVTERIQSVTLQILLRCESDLFLEYYRTFMEKSRPKRPQGKENVAPRKQWVDLLVLWADRRRYMLTEGDRSYIVEQLEGYRMTDLTSSTTQGFRTHIALFLDDVQVNPRKVFAETGQTPDRQTRTLDPRLYFLTSGRKVLEPFPSMHEELCSLNQLKYDNSPANKVAESVSRYSVGTALCANTNTTTAPSQPLSWDGQVRALGSKFALPRAFPLAATTSDGEGGAGVMLVDAHPLNREETEYTRLRMALTLRLLQASNNAVSI